MPFTASHAAVAAPLARRGLILSAVVAGSMAPDFEYFLRLSLISRWGHTLPGVLRFTLPAGLAALWLFHALLKGPLLRLLPPILRPSLSPLAAPFPWRPLRRFVRVILSLLAGIGTHVLLDAFTHEHGPVVERLPVLNLPLLATPFGILRLYQALQCALSVLGAALLALQCWRWLARESLVSGRWRACLPTLLQLRFLAALAGIAVILGLGYGLAGVAPMAGLPGLRRLCGRIFVASTSALVLQWLAFALVQRVRASSLAQPADNGGEKTA